MLWFLNKQEHLLQIEDLSTEVFSVIKSLKECLVPLVLDDVANEDVAIDFIIELCKDEDEDKPEKIEMNPW